MRFLLLSTAALCMIAAPALAQETPATTNGIPNTALSTSSAPSTGPRAREGDLPSNDAAAAIGGGMQAPPTVTAADAPPPVPRSPSDAFPAPAPAASYPTCRAGQFDQCMEPGNGTPTPRQRPRHARR